MHGLAENLSNNDEEMKLKIHKIFVPVILNAFFCSYSPDSLNIVIK